MKSNEIKLEIATLRSALLEVTHRFELLHTAIDNYRCPRCADDTFPNAPPKRIFVVGTQSVILTPSWATIIEELIRKPGKVVTYDRIIYVMWESGVHKAYDHDEDVTNPKGTISAHICNLRKRITKLNCEISTHWGAGLSIWSEEVMSLK